MATKVELHLSRFADSAWRAVVRPWLEAGHGQLERAYVLVPTRGQAHGLKQRCLMENVPLLGVEFLTPGLARKKWRTRLANPQPVMGRELLLLGLRAFVARRLAPVGPADAAWGFWKSLQSDPEGALDDFDELLQAGFSAEDFPLASLREIFVELTSWVGSHGYTFAAMEAARAATERVAAIPPGPGGGEGDAIAARLLVYGLGAEMWGEFFNVAAFVRRCSSATLVLPEPEFRGRIDRDEQWVERWSKLLGVEPLPLDTPDPVETCEGVGALWLREFGGADRARLIVGRTRGDEMRLVAVEIAGLLANGAENIAVIFPRADAAHRELARLLKQGGVDFFNAIEVAGPPPVEVQVQRAVLTFVERGGRLEELLALWPLLRTTGATNLSVADARRASERSFDLLQSHAVAGHISTWERSAPELARVAGILLPAWPPQLPLSVALERFRAICAALGLDEPDGWGMPAAFARQETGPMPLQVVTAVLASFLPPKQAVAGPPGGRGFARVILTTRRRAEGLSWSHLIFVESNAGVWPERRDPSCWLPDESRIELNARREDRLGLYTAEEKWALERAGYGSLARDTRMEIIFSAALFGEADPELKLAPNSWVERVMWTQNRAADADVGTAFERAAVALPPQLAADLSPVREWHAIWMGRRDATRPFDEYFFAGDPALITPDRLPAKLIERGVQDPAELWFEAVLRTRRVAWEPFARARRKAIGQRAHEVLAAALKSDGGAQHGFGEMPSHEAAEARLAGALASLRGQWPADRYWDSFHAELAQVCGGLLENVYALDAGPFVATEAWLPAKAHLQLEARTMPVVGRLDLVRLDRSDWPGAQVDIIDFKTGGDLDLSAARMARSGASLQLGVYLAAAASLGIAGGRVWMIKPELGAMARLEFGDLEVALAKLQWLESALARGVYGALTRDRSGYGPDGYPWPVACTPVPKAVLEQKFERTFGLSVEDVVDE